MTLGGRPIDGIDPDASAVVVGGSSDDDFKGPGDAVVLVAASVEAAHPLEFVDDGRTLVPAAG